jgi:hypothetical protein
MQPLRTAADVMRIVFLLTAVSVLWSVDGLLERDSGQSTGDSARPLDRSR